jgi:hypothetical protein
VSGEALGEAVEEMVGDSAFGQIFPGIEEGEERRGAMEEAPEACETVLEPWFGCAGEEEIEVS